MTSKTIFKSEFSVHFHHFWVLAVAYLAGRGSWICYE